MTTKQHLPHSQTKEWTSAYRVYQSNTGSNTWHIVHAKDNIELEDPANVEEVIISLQGVLWKHDLPPFMEKIHPNSPKVKFLRQSVTLTGFGTSTFENSIKALDEVLHFFDRHIPENKLDECTIIDRCGDYVGIHLMNRYFTPQRESSNEAHIPFEPMVDPSGLLANLEKEGLLTPVRFRIGDIVEAKATLVLIPLRGGHFKLLAILRSLTIMDTSYTQIVQVSANNRIKRLMSSSSPLKRNITYQDEEEEMEIARKKVRESGITQPEFNPALGNSTTAEGSNEIRGEAVGANMTRGREQIGREDDRANCETNEQDDGMPVD
ncbi:hypothetical protein AX14_012357 [Amanita brunnescens Koide BX004]|nr:hypothetical protein AX14_012357 [Amanita brunnescens Koide BX004]